jgi:hypothetical protein
LRRTVPLALFAAAALAGCGSHGSRPLDAVRGGPPPLARPGGWLQSGFGARGTPVVAGGVLLVGASASSAALDARTGRVLWQVRDQLAAVSRRIAAAGRAIGVEHDSGVHSVLVARAARTGRVLWSRAVSGATGTPVRCGAQVCLPDGPDLDAVDPATGATRWRRPDDGPAEIGYADARIVVTSSRVSAAVARSTASGDRVWALPRTMWPAEDTTVDGGAQWYLLRGTLIGAVRLGLVGVDPATGAVRWRRPGWSFVGGGQPTVDDDGTHLASDVVLAVRGGRIAALDAGGRIRWTAPAGRFGGWLGGVLVGWTSDLAEVWALSPSATHGRRVATGAAVAGKRIVFAPFVRPVTRSLIGGYVDAGRTAGGTPVPLRLPAFAGPRAAGLRVAVDEEGNLLARPQG